MKLSTRTWGLFIGALSAVAGACNTSGEPVAGEDIADVVKASTVGNGLVPNGLSFNILGQNILGQNILGQNILGQNILGQNILGQNILGQNILGQNILGQNILGQNILAQNILGQNGNDLLINGLRLKSIVTNAGSTLNATPLSELSFVGMKHDDKPIEALTLAGLRARGFAFGGWNANGLYFGEPLDAFQSAAIQDIYGYVIECALAPDQTVEVPDYYGAPHQFAGVEGLAPEWLSGPPSAAKEPLLAQCVLERSAGEVTYEPVTLDRFKLALKYMVECALPTGVDVSIADETGTPVAFHGSMGLAPEWLNAPLSDTGERRVSACLAARSNALGVKVQLSLRGAGIPVTHAEKVNFPRAEGIFWGNLFSDTPHMQVSSVSDTKGVSGRTCSAGFCAFEFLSLDASAATPQEDGSYHIEGQEVLTVYLPTAYSDTLPLAVSEDHYCFISTTLSPNSLVYCAGTNTGGVLGLGPYDFHSQLPRYSNVGDFENIPNAVIGLPSVAGLVTVGNGVSCARVYDGTVWCWGAAQYGLSHVPTLFGGGVLGDGVFDVDAGNGMVCAVKADGTVWCAADQLSGSVTKVDLPSHEVFVRVEVAQSTDAGYGACAITNSSTMYCWNNNNQPEIIAVDNLGQAFTGVSSICLGTEGFCVTKDDGSLWCENAGGITNDAPTRVASMPDGASDFSQVNCATPSAPGAVLPACVAASNGSQYCFDGTAWQTISTGNAPTTKSVGISSDAGCIFNAADRRGSLECWGDPRFMGKQDIADTSVGLAENYQHAQIVNDVAGNGRCTEEDLYGFDGLVDGYESIYHFQNDCNLQNEVCPSVWDEAYRFLALTGGPVYSVVPSYSDGSSTVCGFCGDGECRYGETIDNCLQDCTSCGDGICGGSELNGSCPLDCAQCGDGICNWNEDATTCALDCSNEECGDGVCGQAEDVATCSQDCGVRNVAAGRPAAVSHPDPSPAYAAAHAVDGDRETFAVNYPFCREPLDGQRFWWRVELGGPHFVESATAFLYADNGVLRFLDRNGDPIQEVQLLQNWEDVRKTYNLAGVHAVEIEAAQNFMFIREVEIFGYRTAE